MLLFPCLTTNTYITVMKHIMLEDETAESVFSRYGIDFAEKEALLKTYNNGISFSSLKAGDKLLIPLNPDLV